MKSKNLFFLGITSRCSPIMKTSYSDWEHFQAQNINFLHESSTYWNFLQYKYHYSYSIKWPRSNVNFLIHFTFEIQQVKVIVLFSLNKSPLLFTVLCVQWNGCVLKRLVLLRQAAQMDPCRWSETKPNVQQVHTFLCDSFLLDFSCCVRFLYLLGRVSVRLVWAFSVFYEKFHRIRTMFLNSETEKNAIDNKATISKLIHI